MVCMKNATATDLARRASRILDDAELGNETRISRGDLAGEPRVIAFVVPAARHKVAEEAMEVVAALERPKDTDAVATERGTS